MRKFKAKKFNLKNKILFIRANWQMLLFALLLPVFVLSFFLGSAQNAQVKTNPPTLFPIGEKLSYKLTFEKFQNAGIAEIYVASRGKLAEKDAVELQARIKTTNLVSAAFYLLDESRTTFASAETGLPLFIKKTSNADVLPRETTQNFLIAPTVNFDLLTLIYQARFSGGAGNFTLQEDEKIYSAIFQAGGAEKIKTDAGEFDTTISIVQSQYFAELGVSDLRINFSADEARIPVMFRFKTPKGEFRAAISGIQNMNPQNLPTPTIAPIPTATPKPQPTPAKYIENMPLSNDLAFKLGETLDYRITANNKYLGVITIQAKERKQFSGTDSLLLTATVKERETNQQILNLSDKIETQVNPDTLSPFQLNVSLGGLFTTYNQTVVFDQEGGKAIVSGTNQVNIPVGTHNVLSLLYAVRSFNLWRSKNENNPINETRVSVFLGSQANVFSIKPADTEIITLNNVKISAQPIIVQTGNQQIDSLGLKIWLSSDDRRLPLRLVVANGLYQADLISERIIPPK